MTLLMTMVVIAVIWGATGVLFVMAFHTRGHKLHPWLTMGLAFGPLTPLLIADAARAQRAAPATILREAEQSEGGLSVLVGVDDSASSEDAVAWVRDNLMPLGVRVTVVTAIDAESAANPGAFTDHESARARLATIAESLGESVGMAIVAGKATDALPHHAQEQGYDMIVVGQHEGFMPPLGSTAQTLAKRSPVTLVVVR